MRAPRHELAAPRRPSIMAHATRSLIEPVGFSTRASRTAARPARREPRQLDQRRVADLRQGAVGTGRRSTRSAPAAAGHRRQDDDIASAAAACRARRGGGRPRLSTYTLTKAAISPPSSTSWERRAGCCSNRSSRASRSVSPRPRRYVRRRRAGAGREADGSSPSSGRRPRRGQAELLVVDVLDRAGVARRRPGSRGRGVAATSWKLVSSASKSMQPAR